MGYVWEHKWQDGSDLGIVPALRRAVIGKKRTGAKRGGHPEGGFPRGVWLQGRSRGRLTLLRHYFSLEPFSVSSEFLLGFGSWQLMSNPLVGVADLGKEIISAISIEDELRLV